MNVNYEMLLQQSNRMKNYVKADVASLGDAVLLKKPGSKKWSAIEVIEHLNKVYDQYLHKFQRALDEAPKLKEEEQTAWQRTLIGRLSIYMVKPKGKKRRFKVKTFDFFRPAVAPDRIHAVIDVFLKNKEVLNGLMLQASTKDLKDRKVSTALGEKIRFYIPECFQFLLVHEERHMIQIEEALARA